MLDEAAEVDKEEVLDRHSGTVFSIWAIDYYNQLMLGEESTVFPKQIKIDDYSPY
jgi:hypothetical protein